MSLKRNTPPAWWAIFIPLGFLVTALVFVIRIFGADALSGASQVALLMASGVAVAVSTLIYGCPWKKLEAAISGNIQSVGTAILILILIGAISGTWMVSGVVPTMMYYGLKILSPSIFLFAACIICALVSVMTGSSWTTVATIGVALMGIGIALGYQPGWTAGAIISGAYFGDKISPLSDTTILASSTSGTPLFVHIRYMLITTVPSISIACLVFLAVSIFHSNTGTTGTDEFAGALQETFNISPWLLLVPVVTLVLILKKVPAPITLFVAVLMACIMAPVFQPEFITSIGEGTQLNFLTGFKGLIITCYGETSIHTGNIRLDDLVQTRGITGMLPTIFLIFCAATFGGTLTGSGMMKSLTEHLIKKISGRTSLVGTTAFTGLLSNMVTGDQYLSIILTASLYKKLFEDKGYESRLLSRTVEDSTTVTSVLIPWNSCGMTQSTVLRISTLEYLPYCIFNLLSPIVTLIIAATGYKITNIVSKNASSAHERHYDDTLVSR